jgi:hypothetical protein
MSAKITNKCTKRVVSSIVTHSYMFRPCWVIFRENFVIVTLRLHFIVEWECAVDCIEAWTLCGAGLQAGTAESSSLQKQRSTQSTAHFHSTIKCNLSVTITKSSPWRWPSSVETCRSVLRLMMKLSLCICWWLVFLYPQVSWALEYVHMKDKLTTQFLDYKTNFWHLRFYSS